MKILVVSDTHRKDDGLKMVIEKEKPLDMLIHLGDAEGSERYIAEWVNPECRLEMVLGNNDFFSMLDREREITIGNCRALLTHGHYYGVSMGAEGLAEEARNRGCGMALFGHTHRPYYGKIGGVVVINPGSLSYPRQEGKKGSYGIMTVTDDGEVEYSQNFL